MLPNSNTLKNQLKLAEYCKTGEDRVIEGVTPNRIHHYRRLIFNIALDTLSSAFPITKKLFGNEVWKTSVNEFYSKSNCTSPFVWKMAQDFYDYAIQEDSFLALKDKRPFLLDLLHFELIELDMYMMEDAEIPQVKKEGSMYEDTIIPHPESKIILLNYPVHLKPPKEISLEDKKQYYCLCFREPVDRKILFFDLSAYYAFVIEQLFNKKTLLEISEEASASLRIEASTLVEKTKPFIEHLDSKGFIVGYS
jgi:hypothetical protein